MDWPSLVAGVLLGSTLAYLLLRIQLEKLSSRHAEALTEARRDSVSRSRAVLKGKMAEQIAPLLPGFDYWPSDARFLGDPVDYVIFNGYSRAKDGHEDEPLEIVIVDIKEGRARLNRGQRLIAQAVAAGRVRFEVVRVSEEGQITHYDWSGA